MIITILLAYLLGNGYIFWKLWNFMGSPSSKWAITCFPTAIKISVAIIFWSIAFALFISIGARNLQMPSVIFKILHLTGSCWLVFMLYTLMLLAVTDLARLIIPALRTAGWFSSSNIFPWCCGIVTVILIGGYINYINPQIVPLNITLNQKELAAEQTEKQTAEQACKPLKIVAVSDIHLGYGTGKHLISKYVKKINAQKPDIVLIVGDLIDNSIKPVKEKGLHKELDKIEAPFGIYMVPGNHEYISGISDCKRLLSKTRIKLLQDSTVTIPFPNTSLPDSLSGTYGGLIRIIGRDDRSNRNRKTLEALLQVTHTTCTASSTDQNHDASKANIEKEIVYTILIDHQPYDLAMADSPGIDLQIYGHTHHGQIWPISLLTEKIYEQSHGVRKWNNSHIYVSSGLSLWGPPFRIGTQSEIGVVEISL